jgi:hypothetical protein
LETLINKMSWRSFSQCIKYCTVISQEQRYTVHCR